MKVAIIGGGIAGLTQGIFLSRQGYDVQVFERTPQMENRGHAFLMSEDGIELLNSFATDESQKLASKKVDLFSLKRPTQEELIKIPLNEWNCLKRVDLIRYLTSFYSADKLIYGHEFSHFNFDADGTAKSVVFKNEKVIEADLFIAADGSHSAIRQTLFGVTNYTRIEVKEIVGISQYSSNNPYNVFQKIQCADKGLAFGYIPATENESVWFLQYDVKQELGRTPLNPEQLKHFCSRVLADFPEEVKLVLDNNDFSTSYIWNTRDFDVLPSFHKKNIVLIGDAAHLALPFTSAGTTNAIRDAATLTNTLSSEQSIEAALTAYYHLRKDELASHINQGRELKKIFLEPEKYSERGFLLPLITEKYDTRQKKVKKPLKIAYFTDPICSTCWIFQPLLRKLHLEYDHAIEISYHMGGLLPDWPSQQENKIKSPTDAAQLWYDMAKEHAVPMSGEVWINDPLDSSYPPSLAFKAAQLQDDDKAISFLRKMKELLFIEKKNISKWPFLERAALMAGLDAALLKRDMEGVAKKTFEDDLNMAKSLGIRVFPTLVLKVEGKLEKIIKGYQTYDALERLIKNYLPSVEKSTVQITPKELFERFSNMTESEFCFLMNCDEDSSLEILKNLEQSNFIKQIRTEQAEYWELI